ncbi:hypothetical protein LI117_11190, partial [Sutterella wadsworthensis]|uniref:hypothetical protein n=1 Tax=Sutterella wadsworthensis TaxID=40545 RepID=UPI001D08F654
GLCRFWARVLGHVFHQIATNLIDGCGWFVIDGSGWNLIVAKHLRMFVFIRSHESSPMFVTLTNACHLSH